MKTGIWPINLDVIPTEAFSPSLNTMTQSSQPLPASLPSIPVPIQSELNNNNLSHTTRTSITSFTTNSTSTLTLHMAPQYILENANLHKLLEATTTQIQCDYAQKQEREEEKQRKAKECKVEKKRKEGEQKKKAEERRIKAAESAAEKALKTAGTRKRTTLTKGKSCRSGSDKPDNDTAEITHHVASIPRPKPHPITIKHQVDPDSEGVHANMPADTAGYQVLPQNAQLGNNVVELTTAVHRNPPRSSRR
ncbi:hypothetical protein BDQ17DRAFT_1433375 [Cyathus striatus]|nr:hypothetical protein BDQ17DRAFT_1433375 [Cyathus striatus]